MSRRIMPVVVNYYVWLSVVNYYFSSVVSYFLVVRCGFEC